MTGKVSFLGKVEVFVLVAMAGAGLILAGTLTSWAAASEHHCQQPNPNEVFCGAIKEQSGPSAVGLLRGAELARSEHKRYRSTINSRRGPDESRAVLEVDDGKFRVEYVNRHGDRKVTVRGGQGEEFYSYHHGHDQVKLHGADDTDAQATNFSLVCLGLSDMLVVPASMDAGAALRRVMFLDAAESAEVVGKESVGGVELWRVRAVRDNGAIAEFWIEEPGFRVHRRVLISSSGARQTQVDSDFGQLSGESPFPTRVVAQSWTTADGELVRHVEFTLHQLELGAEIEPERFSLAAMEVPLGTRVVDYRISRRIGYWDGSEIVESRPVVPLDAPELAQDVARRWQLMLLGSGGLLLLVALMLFWRRKWR